MAVCLLVWCLCSGSHVGTVAVCLFVGYVVALSWALWLFIGFWLCSGSKVGTVGVCLFGGY